MKILPKAALAAALLAATASPASATIHNCLWRIERVGVDSGGGLAMRFVGGNSDGSQVYLCNMGATSYGVTPEACRGWMSQLVAAQSLGRQVGFSFDTSHSTNGGLGTTDGCNASKFTGWNFHVPFIVSLEAN